MELTGPQFTGKHAAPYSGHTDLQKLAGNMKPKTPYVAKHATGTMPPPPKPPTTKPPTQAKKPTTTDSNTGGKTGRPGDARPRQAQYPHRYYHHDHSPTEQMHALVGFQGDAGRTVA